MLYFSVNNDVLPCHCLLLLIVLVIGSTIAKALKMQRKQNDEQVCKPAAHKVSFRTKKPRSIRLESKESKRASASLAGTHRLCLRLAQRTVPFNRTDR